MKTLMNSFAGLALTLMSALALISCDPCSSVVCNNGTCSNGVCVCEDGYERNNSSCVAVNKLYVGTGTVTATVVSLDVAGNSTTRTNVGYTLTASDVDPYMFTLEKFSFLIKNDIAFTISSSNYELIEAGTALTEAGNNYTYRGTRTGSQVVLTITDSSNGTIYTISFVA
ncbi:MAG: Unknown protein [uncultured Aureispira sp.]|uniref:EGF-like domain-containing protein n=1 Tax=uncultured Aureispira sp. TaxID=1331704 RepID=A0A6S6UBR3_9BACT|nr:MAG: Unknown protein [uncultured Aureispira sp.]